jgi:hypothetical protein
MPAPLLPGPHLGRTLLLDLGREQWTESVLPGTHRLVADIDPSFMKQVLDLPQ